MRESYQERQGQEALATAHRCRACMTSRRPKRTSPTARMRIKSAARNRCDSEARSCAPTSTPLPAPACAESRAQSRHEDMRDAAIRLMMAECEVRGGRGYVQREMQKVRPALGHGKLPRRCRAGLRPSDQETETHAAWSAERVVVVDPRHNRRTCRRYGLHATSQDHRESGLRLHVRTHARWVSVS